MKDDSGAFRSFLEAVCTWEVLQHTVRRPGPVYGEVKALKVEFCNVAVSHGCSKFRKNSSRDGNLPEPLHWGLQADGAHGRDQEHFLPSATNDINRTRYTLLQQGRTRSKETMMHPKINFR